jgi:peptidyl-prolyl cis-trans isomerase C
MKENISQAKYTFDDYRKIVEVNLLRNKLNQALAQEVAKTGEQIHVRHILVKTFEEAQKVEERLKAGEDFEKLAEELSTDPSAKTNKGDLGWSTRGTFVTEFDNAAWALTNPLQISAPVTTTFGVHVIQLVEKDANRALDADALASKEASALTDWLQKVRADATTKIERFFSTDYVPSEIKRLQTPSAQ